MKITFILWLGLSLALPLLAQEQSKSINLSIALKEVTGLGHVEFKKQIQVELEKAFTIREDKIAREIEILVSQKMPKGIKAKAMSGPLFYDMKIYNLKHGKKKLVASPQIVAKLGQMAKLEGQDGQGTLTLEISSH